MATTLNGINFSGQDTNDIFVKYMTDSLFLTQVQPTMMTALKGKFVYHKLDENIDIEAFANCPTSTTGGGVIDQISEDLCRWMVTAEFSHDDLINTYLQKEYGLGYRGEKINETRVFNSLLSLFGDKVRTQLDDIIWNGDTTSLTPYLATCDGILKKFAADAVIMAQDVAGTTVTVSNVLTEMNKVTASAATNAKHLLYRNNLNEPVSLYVSFNVAEAYGEHLTQQGQGFNYFSPDKAPSMIFKGRYQVVPLYNLPANTMIMTYGKNFVFATDAEEDFARFRVVDISETDGWCDVVRVKMAARHFAGYIRPEDIIWYHV